MSRHPRTPKASAGTALILALMVGLLAAFVCGCGGGSSASGSSGSGTDQSSPQDEPSSQFRGSEAADKFANFGTEAASSEREQAAELVAQSLSARAAHNWAAQCATLSNSVIKVVEASPTSKGQHGCAKALGAQGEQAPASILEDNLEGAVVALRIKGKKGYALYHGNDEKDWAMPMEKDGSTWKVDGLVAEQVPD